MHNITIVTAFFDLGRESWVGFERSVDLYLNRFKHLTKLNNRIIVYTSKDLVQKIQHLSEKIIVLEYDFLNETLELCDRISAVQTDDRFLANVSPGLRGNPEYWSPQYIAVNAYKSVFVSDAISRGLVKSNMVAWIDFGYCLDDSIVPITSWNYDFNSNKIHLFRMKEIDASMPIENATYSGEVYIQGCHIVGPKNLWPILKHSIFKSLDSLISNNLVDDDQTLLLMSYLAAPDIFELHDNSPDDWFRIFKDYSV